MNFYKQAISKNDVLNFFRGKNEYFDLDRDWGVHNNATTALNILGFRHETIEEELFRQLNEDLLNFIKEPDFDFQDFNSIIGFIWFYLVYRFTEKKIETDWHISQELIDLMNTKWEYYNHSNEDVSNINRVISNMKVRYDFVLFQ
jgi:hypothetical protein